jgi:predicted transcriptional regulator of viral defense system
MYQEFRKSLEKFVVITLADIRMAFPDFDQKNLVYWQKKGYIIKLKNGCYIFSDLKPTEHTLFLIANKLYEPSYVSLESALSYYGIIPEGVYSIQSVSTRKTQVFNNPTGTFRYYSLKSSLYFGYRLISEEVPHTYRMASLEKAVLDFFYLRPDIDTAEALDALRWNRAELANLDTTTLDNYLSLFESRILYKKVDLLYNHLNA